MNFVKYTLFLLIIHSTLYAQNNDGVDNMVDLGTGIAYSSLKRVVVSDFKHTGFSYPTFHFGYTRPSEKWTHEGAFYFSYARLQSPFEGNYSTDTRGELTYKLHKKIIENHQLKTWVGGLLNTMYSLQDYKANGVDRGNTQSLQFSAAIGGLVRLEYGLPKGELLAEVNWFPFSLNRRTGYANQFTGIDSWSNSSQNGDYEATPWALSTVDIYSDQAFSLTYRFPFSWNTDMDIRYSMRYYSFDTPEFYGFLSQNISTIFKFRF